MQELAEKILDMVGSTSKVTYHPLPQDDPVQRRPDISLADDALNWRPTINIEAGLQKTISYFETRL